MEKLSRLSPDQRSNLVAYLDGELDGDSVKEIERILNQSPVARNDVELLARTYDLLNELPRPEAKTEFTQKTLQAIQAPDPKSDLKDSAAYQAFRAWVKTIAMGIGAMACGAAAFGAVRYWVPRPYDPLLDDLPMLKELHRYKEVGDFEFLRTNLRQSPNLYEQMQEGVNRGQR